MNENRNENRNEPMGVAIDDEQLDQIAGGFTELLEALIYDVVTYGQELLTEEIKSWPSPGFGGAESSW